MFEYLGKIVDSKLAQENVKTRHNDSQDQGVCKINDEGELKVIVVEEAWYWFSEITEENDNYKTSRSDEHEL